MAGDYMKISLPGLYFQMLTITILIFFTAMGKAYVPLLLISPFIFLHLLWSSIFVNRMGYGFNGLAMAGNFTYSSCCLSLILYMSFSKDEELSKCLSPFKFSESFSLMDIFMKLAIISLFWSINDFWGPQSINLMSGMLG